MRDKTVSIAMAVCNGEKYLIEQIESIIIQMEDKDELIISYDPSEDKTFQIIKEYEKKDPRIRVIVNEDHSRGLVSNFDNALRNCQNEIIFYSDQDDVWMENKINKMLDCFDDSTVTVAIHDAKLTDKDLTVLEESSFNLRGGARSNIIGNLVRLSYIGCCMAFKSELLDVISPLPTKKRSHDWWTGCICMKYGKMSIVKESLILHRIHEENATPKKRPGLWYQVQVRCIIIINLIKRHRKYK